MLAAARRHSRRGEAGDTLIEVLFAITVLSLVVVLALSLMNQGVAASTRSLQITLVRQEMDSQAETLRFLNAAYVGAYRKDTVPTTGPAGEYYKITQAIKGNTTATTFGNNASVCPAAPNGSFFVNPKTATYQTKTTTSMVLADNFAQLAYSPTLQSRGLWVEGIPSTARGGTKYTDFHIW